MKEKVQLISGAVIFRPKRIGYVWFLVKKNPEDNWEILKSIVRKGESSVRASIRASEEQAGMKAKVLAEAGRVNAVTRDNGKVIKQKYLYYFMLYKIGGEVLGFSDHIWLDYQKASRKLSSKRDKIMLKNAYNLFKEWKKKQKKRGRPRKI
ncbi:MAG: NUDIX domain-containing protein [Patescibacteria group bacterium]